MMRLEPMLPADVASEPDEAPDFNHRNRVSQSEQPVPQGGVPRALREAAEMSGLDLPAELFNEALSYANDGHLRLARDRLLMLLSMVPDDSEAHLLLAQVHIKSQQWSEALAVLDTAHKHNVVVPRELRRAVEDHLRAEAAAEEEQKAALRAREQGESAALRGEVRRLRSENAALVGRTNELEREARRWAWITAGVSGVVSLFLLATLAAGLGGPSAPEATAPAEATPAAVAAVPEAGAPEEGPAPVAGGDRLTQQVAEALRARPELTSTGLQLQVEGTTVRLTGEVVAHQQKTLAVETASRVDGVTKVLSDRVVVTARTRGATHVVVSKDTLSKIAKQYYGDGNLSDRILKANEGTLHGKAGALQIGMELVIPRVE